MSVVCHLHTCSLGRKIVHHVIEGKGTWGWVPVATTSPPGNFFLVTFLQKRDKIDNSSNVSTFQYKNYNLIFNLKSHATTCQKYQCSHLGCFWPPTSTEKSSCGPSHASPEMETLQRYDAKTSRLAASSVEKHQIFHIGLYNNSWYWKICWIEIEIWLEVSC